MKKVLMVSGMLNTTLAFEALKKSLIEAGDTVELYASTMPPVSETVQKIKDDVEWADIVLVGMASSPELAAGELVAVTQANTLGKPFGLFADKSGVIAGRDWFTPVRDRASFVFIQFEDDVELAQKTCPHAAVVVTNHPKNEDAAAVNIPPEQIRARLGISQAASMVFVPGTKTLDICLEVLGLVKEAFALSSRPEFTVVFGQHPGDQNDVSNYDGFGAVVVPKSAGIRAEDLIPAADVFGNILSTTVDRVMFLRKPALWIRTPSVVAFQRDKEGINLPILCDRGLALAVYNAREFVNAIEQVKNGQFANLANQQALQAKMFPQPPPRGTAVRLMAETLENVLEARLVEAGK